MPDFRKIAGAILGGAKQVAVIGCSFALLASAEIIGTRYFTPAPRHAAEVAEPGEELPVETVGNRQLASVPKPRPVLAMPGSNSDSSGPYVPTPNDRGGAGESFLGASDFSSFSGTPDALPFSEPMAGSSSVLTNAAPAPTNTSTTADAGRNYVPGYGGTSTSTSTSTSSSTTTTVSKPSALSYSTATAVYLTGSAITANTPVVTGIPSGYTVNPALPAGLSLSSSGIISGTPTATVAAADYQITAYNSAGSTTAFVNIRTGPGFQVNDLGDTADASAGDGTCATAGGVCTLRAAIQEANALGGATNRLILVPAGTITLGGTEIALNSNLEVIGQGMTSTIISGNNTSRIFNASTSHAYSYGFSKLTLQNGNAGANSGGCVYALGNNFTISYVKFNNCTTGGAGFGGGFYAFDEWGGDTSILTVSYSSFTNNTAGNKGGGLSFDNTKAGNAYTISYSTFMGNYANASGGGLSISAPTGTFTANLVDSNSVNLANGGAGGISISPGTYSFSNNTISNNSGGGIGTNNGTTLTLINNTFTANATPGNGQYFGGSAVQMNTGGVATLQNNIFLNNTLNGVKSNCAIPTITSNGGNVSDTVSGDCSTTLGSDHNSVSAALGSLADNGGPTQTMALQAGSVGVDQGVNTSCPTTDQRGYARPANGTCDAGAFEIQ